VATWWERRFPWLLDALIALDPDPLFRVLAPVGRVPSAAMEWVCLPLARGVEGVGRLLHAARRGGRTGLGALMRAVPLPGPVQDWLWLRPIRLADTGFENAQQLWRSRTRRAAPAALFLAVVTHGLAFVLWPAIRVEDVAVVSSELAAVTLPPSVDIPPPPQAIQRPARPVLAATDVADDVTIAPTTFEAQPVAALPPPTIPKEVEQPRRPTFTPFTVAPTILNADEVRGLLILEYPPLLREAGIGGEILMWIYLDATGKVEEVRIARGSGYEELDGAAIRVAERIRFTPALNRDQNVAAWVQFPIEFKIR